MSDSPFDKMIKLIDTSDAFKEIKSKKDKVIIVDDSIIEIDGVKYRRREQKPLSRGAGKMVMMAMALAGVSYGESNYKRSRPHVNIVEEYKLILQKKSELGRPDRDWVVNQFNYLYEKI